MRISTIFKNFLEPHAAECSIFSMNFIELLFIAAALSMDAFAVSIACGLSASKIPFKNMAAVALSFGIFQALMPVIGWNLSEFAYEQIKAYDHWTAFFLLFAVGAKMVWDSLRGHGGKKCFAFPLNLKALFALSVATSLDALAVGVSFSCLRLPIIFPALTIGITTFLFCLSGIMFGKGIGRNADSKFTLAGGIILILIGVKILADG